MIYKNKSIFTFIFDFVFGALCVLIWGFLVFGFTSKALLMFQSDLLKGKQIDWLIINIVIITISFLLPAFLLFRIIPKTIELNKDKGTVTIRSYFCGHSTIKKNTVKIFFSFNSFDGSGKNFVLFTRYGIFLINSEIFEQPSEVLNILIVEK